MTSAPFSSSQIASLTMVAGDITMQPAALTRAKSAASGRPKWKLTTSGFNSSTKAHIATSNGARLSALTGAAGSIPSSL